MSSSHHRGPADGEWHVLVSTNRGLEEITRQELATLVGCDSTIHHPGMVRCSADEAAIYRLHASARSIHRVLLELVRTECHSVEEMYELVRELDISHFLGPDQSFAVRTQRRGDHEFTSMDVERVIGQAIIDEYRSRKRTRPPVDLDDPAVIFRVFVREQTVVVTIDTTGQRSLHRRDYRISEHDAPLRPTIAYAMCQYANYRPGDRLVDPMCGCGTIPIEAAQAERARPPKTEPKPALTRLRFLDPERYTELIDRDRNRECSLEIGGFDVDETAVASARRNATAAGLDGEISFETADATRARHDADVIVADMPFGIRTDGNLRSLYTGFFDRLETSDWKRLVVHTARADLVPLEPTREIEMRRGRLETVILIIE